MIEFIKKNWSTGIGILVIMLLGLFYWLFNDKDIDYIAKDFSITIAEIIDHSSVGIGNGYYIKYSYRVNSETYIKEINYTQKFIDCYKSRECIGKKFLLFFRKNDPNYSIIDFEREYDPCQFSRVDSLKF